MYEKLIIWQYQSKAKAVATVKLLSDLCAEYQDVLARFPLLFNIDKAEGYHLDAIGRIVGVSRVVTGYKQAEFFGFTRYPKALGFSVKGKGGGEWYRSGSGVNDDIFLSDKDFRWLIKSKIWKNSQRGDLTYLAAACASLLGSSTIIQDNYDMTVTIFLPPQVYGFKKWAIENMDILPRPQGVKYNIREGATSNKYFGFYGSPDAEAFNVGVFFRNNSK